MENLGRGVVATRTSENTVLVSWRLLGLDPEGIAFNLYRSTGGGAPVKLNPAPLTAGTNFVDYSADVTTDNTYHVTAVMAGGELSSSAPYVLKAGTPVSPVALRIPLQPVSDPASYVQHAWVGDLDGDGEYDFVVVRLNYVEAYKRDGTFLWRVDLGPLSENRDNIEPGPATLSVGHNDGLTVHDMDNDGRAEVILKTANGVVFGNGTTLVHGVDDEQFVSVLDGLTGAERARAPVPTEYVADGPVSGHFGIAYLDGANPSVVFKFKNRVGSGAFNLGVTTWDFNGSDLVQRWKFMPGTGGNFPNFHQIRIFDVDGDGRDEICDGGYVLDDDGSVLYTLGDQGVVHGDRFHITDMDPSRPGIEGFAIQQNNPSALALYYYDVATGEILRRHYTETPADLARGIAADIDPRYPGYEYWSFTGIHNATTGEMISPDPQRPWPNFRIWWDGTVMSNLFNHTTVDSWDYINRTPVRLLQASSYGAVRTTRDASPFYGDILGDWREEILYENSARTELLIFTTPHPSDVRLYTLPHNPAYRMSLNLKGYMQSHHVDYYLGHGMEAPPAPDIRLVEGAATIAAISPDTGRSDADFVTTSGNITLSGRAAPGASISLSRAGAGEIASLVADGAGAWTYDYSATTLAEGVHHFEAVATTDGISVASPILAVTVDQSAPAAPVVVRADVLGLISGTAEAGALVSVFNGADSLGTALADMAGNWSLSLAEGLPAGSLTLTATAADRAGNTSATSAIVSIDTGLTTPLITGITPDTGVSSADALTNASSLVLQGTAGNGALVQITRGLNGVPVGQATADGGIWSLAWDAAEYADGQHVFHAYAIDGGSSSPASVAFVATLDRVVPLVKSIVRQVPDAETITAATSSVIYRVEFSEEVAGVSANHFALFTTGSASGAIESVSAVSARVYDVTVNSLDGIGTLRLDLGAAPGGLIDLAGNAIADAYTNGAAYTRALSSAGDGTWTNIAGGLWSSGANWQDYVIADDGGDARFDTLDISGTVTVTLDSPRSVRGIRFGDTDTSDEETLGTWVLKNSNGASSPLAFTERNFDVADNVTVALQVPLAGSTGFRKRETGTLLIQSDSTASLSGNLNIDAGLTSLVEGGAVRAASVSVANGGAHLNVNGGSLVATGSSTLTAGGGTQISIDAGALRFEGGLATSNTNSGAVFRVRGGQFYASSLSMHRSDAGLNYNTGLIVTGGEALLGTLNLGTGNSWAATSVEGGRLEVTGRITIGNQSSGGRGGALRVTGGQFVSSDTTDGIVMHARVGVANVAQLNLLGGESFVGRVTFGISDQITNGSGALLVDGGELYLGAGGIVKKATDGMATSVTLARGTLGATENWSTSHPVVLSGAGAVSIKAADSVGASHNIQLTGVISGPGGFAKSGDGALILGAANTFTGAVAVDAGRLVVDGSVAAGASLAVNANGMLAGTGSIERIVTLNTGGLLSPAGEAGGHLNLASVTWNRGAKLRVDLGASQDSLTIAGALSKGDAGSGSYEIVIVPGEGFTTGSYTLATFGSSDFAGSDFSVAGLGEYTGTVHVSQSALTLTISAPLSPFEEWAETVGLPIGQRGPLDDPDGDGLSNLFEFALALDPLTPGASDSTVSVMEEGGERYPAITFLRRQNLGDVFVAVQVSTGLDFVSLLGAVEISAAPNGDGAETVIVRSAVPLSQAPRQFFRVTVSESASAQ